MAAFLLSGGGRIHQDTNRLMKSMRNGDTWNGRTLEIYAGGADDPARQNASPTGYYLRMAERIEPVHARHLEQHGRKHRKPHIDHQQYLDDDLPADGFP